MPRQPHFDAMAAEAVFLNFGSENSEAPFLQADSAIGFERPKQELFILI